MSWFGSPEFGTPESFHFKGYWIVGRRFNWRFKVAIDEESFQRCSSATSNVKEFSTQLASLFSKTVTKRFDRHYNARNGRAL